MVLGITRYHRDGNGWNDVGYNFLVDRYGQVFEGRAGGVDQAIVGAQAQGWNTVSTGIACLGTFTDVAQTEAGLDALARLIGWKLSVHGVPVAGPGDRRLLGGAVQPLPRRDAGRVRAHLRAPRRQRDGVPGRGALRAAAGAAGARGRATPGRWPA